MRGSTTGSTLAASSIFWMRIRIRTSVRARSSLQLRATMGWSIPSCCSASCGWEWARVPSRRPAELTTAGGRSGSALICGAPYLRTFVQRKHILELCRRKSADTDLEQIAGLGIRLHSDHVKRILERIAFDGTLSPNLGAADRKLITRHAVLPCLSSYLYTRDEHV